MSQYGHVSRPTRIPFTCVTCDAKRKFRAENSDPETGVIEYRCPSCEEQTVRVEVDP